MLTSESITVNASVENNYGRGCTIQYSLSGNFTSNNTTGVLALTSGTQNNISARIVTCTSNQPTPNTTKCPTVTVAPANAELLKTNEGCPYDPPVTVTAGKPAVLEVSCTFPNEDPNEPIKRPWAFACENDNSEPNMTFNGISNFEMGVNVFNNWWHFQLPLAGGENVQLTETTRFLFTKTGGGNLTCRFY
jgi:hypothetical protein